MTKEEIYAEIQRLDTIIDKQDKRIAELRILLGVATDEQNERREKVRQLSRKLMKMSEG